MLQSTGPQRISRTQRKAPEQQQQRYECACQRLYTSCGTVLLNFSRYCTARLKMFSLFCVCVFVFYVCIICVNSIINLVLYSTM